MTSFHLKKISLALPAVLILLLVTAATAHAQLLFDNGPAGPDSTGPHITSMVGNIFTPIASGTAITTRFYGTSSSEPPDSFTLSLYSAPEGSPGSLIGTSTLSNLTSVDTGIQLSNGELYQFSGTLDSPFTLDSSLTYYLGYTNTSESDFALALTEIPGPATVAYAQVLSIFVSIPAVDRSPSYAFTLNPPPAAVPEPSSCALGLMALGVLTLAVYRRQLGIVQE